MGQRRWWWPATRAASASHSRAPSWPWPSPGSGWWWPAGEVGGGDVEGKLWLVQLTQVCPRWALLSPQELRKWPQLECEEDAWSLWIESAMTQPWLCVECPLTHWVYLCFHHLELDRGVFSGLISTLTDTFGLQWNFVGRITWSGSPRMVFFCFFLISLYWSAVALQCCTGFYHSKVTQLYVHLCPLLFGFPSDSVTTVS